MTYREFIPTIGNQLQEQTTTNIRYNRQSIVWLLLLDYVLDTYEFIKGKDKCKEFENTSIVLRKLEDISKHLGGFKLTLNTI